VLPAFSARNWNDKFIVLCKNFLSFLALKKLVHVVVSCLARPLLC
jgi:hypothetical protein